MEYSIKKESISLIILLASWILGFYFYTKFSDQVITHWNFEGVADGYSGKALGAFLMPIIELFIYLLFLFLPSFDPKRENYQKFAKTYNQLRIVFLLFFFLIFLITGLINLNVNIPVNIILPALIGFLFIFLGSTMSKIEQNWFVGFRLPWTLSSEYVWKKTHRFGGWSFIFFGGLLFLIPLLPKMAGTILFIFGILLIVFGTSIYSYLIFQKEKGSSKQITVETKPQE